MRHRIETSLTECLRATAMAVAMTFSGGVLATTAHAENQIPWRTPDAATAAQPRITSGQAARAIRNLAQEVNANRHVIVQFSQPVTNEQRTRLANAGLDLQSSLGNNGYFAHMTRHDVDVAQLSAVASLSLATPIRPAMKLHETLLPNPVSGAYENVPDWADVGSEILEDGGDPVRIVAAYVVLHRDVRLADGAQIARQFDANIIAELRSINGLVIELPLARLADFAADDAVQWIEPPLPPMDVTNSSARATVQTNTVQSAPYGLDGDGVTVLVYDGGYALASHSDFSGRLTVRDSSGLSDHATHVSGTIGGDGSVTADNRGMAPAVTIESYGFEYDGSGVFLYSNPGDLENDYDEAINTFGAVIANNSIGTNTETNGFPCAIQGDYGVTSSVIDAIVRGSLGDTMRIVWANGNERQGSSCDVEGYGDYYSTAPPATAKNHLTVGALNSNDNSMTSFSSWGPVDDGRIKPDISAPGCQSNDDGGLTSTSSSGGYTVKCGTSMASPVTTGCAALLLQDFRATFPAFPDYLPSTQKALFVQNALDLGNTGPDYQFGYGMIQIQDTIDYMRTGNFVEGAIGQGGTQFLFVTVDPGTPELKITMAWDDFPGTPNVNPALVNNLDLKVTGPGGPYFPWTLDPANPSVAAVRTVADSVNNIEQVVIDNPAAGEYTIEISGTNVPEGPQTFSIVGAGMIVGTNIAIDSTIPELVEPATDVTVTTTIVAINETLIVGSPTLHYRAVGEPSFTGVAMPNIGGDVYEASFTASGNCDDAMEFYVSAEGSQSGVVANPPNGPVTTYSFGLGALAVTFNDNFEADLGWTVSDGGTLTDGTWDRGVPESWGRGDPPSDGDGSGQCYLTDNDSTQSNSDVDGGTTTLTSPTMDASVPNAILTYERWFSNDSGDGANSDTFLVEISDDNGGSWSVLETVGPAGAGTSGGWIHVEYDMAAIGGGFTPNDQFRIRFTAEDVDPQSIVEAAVDGVVISSFSCDDVTPACDADTNGDNQVDTDDFLAILANWGACPAPCPPNCGPDVVPDCNVNTDDFLLVLANWGPCIAP